MDFVTVDKIKKIREITGIGILNCRKALEKTGGDIDAAIKELHMGKAFNKSTNIDSMDFKNGYIHIIASECRTSISMVEVSCKTDFVSLNAEFRQYVKDLTLCVLENKILNKDYLSKVTDVKVVELVFDRLFFLSKKFGENLTIKNVLYLGSFDEFYGFYLHNINNVSRIGVVVVTDVRNDIVSDNVAMHIAALSPSNIQSLLEQGYVLDEKISVKLYLQNNNVNIKKYIRFALGV